MIKGLRHLFAQIFIPETFAIVSACVCFQGHRLSIVEDATQSVKVVSWNIGMSLKQGLLRTSSRVQKVADGNERITSGTFSDNNDETVSF
jgi:hypothetical protein